MDAMTDVHNLHSYVLLFLCLLFIVAKCSCWHCSVIEIRSLVLARDDGSLAFCYILWMCTIFRQKNIRTKDSFKGQMYIQAGLLFICPLNVCT